MASSDKKYVAFAEDTSSHCLVGVWREMAAKRHGGCLVHNKDGEIRTRNSYGNDPKDRRG
jgi:hypothetical protein